MQAGDLADATSLFGAVATLPRGPHRLSREEVESSQRTRLLAAVTHLVAERGYARATITEVARRAGVAPNAFYRHFADVEECYLGAYDVFAADLLGRLAAAVAPAEDWAAFIAAALHAYLGALDAEPAVTRAFLLEIDAAGPAGRARRRAAYRGFAALMAERHARMRAADPSLGPLPERVYLGLVFAIRELVCDALESSPAARLADLAPDVETWIAATIRGAA